MMRLKISNAVAGLLVLGSACADEPVPLHIGEDGCERCHMTISDERYAAQLVTKKGKAYKFDSAECLAGFYTNAIAVDEVASLWVTDFHTQSRMIRVEEAFFLRSKDLRSPMGMNLTAFGDGIAPQTVLNSFIGEVLTWDEVVELVRTEGVPTGGMHAQGDPHSRDVARANSAGQGH
ncbi:MAG: nitrous oxide reductase accessory protein NosL [Gemmatimonadota bacterium]|nr:MAG: nitrous oxide reductase accessory protein NosL [Gemmatimonadota bacterium]